MLTAELTALADYWHNLPTPVGHFVCRACSPLLYPTAATAPIPQGAGHVGVRFASFQLNINRMLVYLDGVPLRTGVEAMTGEDGWVIEQLAYAHTEQGALIVRECACNPDYPAERLRFGAVKVVPQIWTPDGYRND